MSLDGPVDGAANPAEGSVDENAAAPLTLAQALAPPKLPTNIVTSWGSTMAQRVLACRTNQEPGTLY